MATFEFVDVESLNRGFHRDKKAEAISNAPPSLSAAVFSIRRARHARPII
jgi:hypothetical protein